MGPVRYFKATFSDGSVFTRLSPTTVYAKASLVGVVGSDNRIRHAASFHANQGAPLPANCVAQAPCVEITGEEYQAYERARVAQFSADVAAILAQA